MTSACRIFSVAVGILSVISLPSQAALVDIQREGGVAYFTYTAPDKVVRYDMAAEAFLPDIELSGIPRAIAVEKQRLVIGYHDNADTIDLDTLKSSFLTQTDGELREIEIVNGVAYFNLGEKGLLSVGLDPNTAATGALLSAKGSAIIGSDLQSAVFMRATGGSPSDIGKIRVTDAGTVISSIESFYQQELPEATSLFLFPEQDRLIDSSGVLYYTHDLSFAGQISGTADDVVFVDKDLIVLRADQLVRYDSALQEVSSLELEDAPASIGHAANSVFAFYDEADTIRVEKLALSSLADAKTAALKQVPDFEPELVEFDETTGIVYLIDQESQGLYLWSADSESYTAIHTLDTMPTWATFSAAHQRLYLGYDTGSISFVDLRSAHFDEQAFAHLPSAVLGLKAAGDFVFAADRSGSWNRHYSFSDRGRLIDSQDWQDVGHQYVWNPVTERIYHLGSYSDELKWIALSQQTGKFGSSSRTFQYSDAPALPLRLDPAGQALIAGDGRIYDLSSAEVSASVSTPISDAVWMGKTLFTLSVSSEGSSIHSLNADFTPVHRHALAGKASRLFGYAGKLLVLLHSDNGATFVSVEDSASEDATVKTASERTPALYSAGHSLVI
ncbi:hypothetical protein [Allohahella marinimesophila]|uniref:Uncharacterized protein n=1 Tax=Allohahella marinimesophila TaxID=1054972 RepID=A0ABP7NZZ0_9GAMM